MSLRVAATARRPQGRGTRRRRWPRRRWPGRRRPGRCGAAGASAASAALVAVALAATAIVAACAHGGWVVDNPDVADRARARPEAFVEDAAAQWQGLDALAGSYRARVSRGAGSRSLDLAVVAARPDRLRVEMLAPTGSSEGYLVAGPQEIGLWLGEEGRLYRGPHTPEAFARALGVDLSAADAVAVLFGFGVASDEAGPAEWLPDEQRIRVPADRGEAFLHPLTLRFDRLRFGGAEVELADWAEGPAPVPQRVRIEAEADDLSIELRLASSWIANPTRISEAFMVQPPRGPVEEVSLEELAREGGLLRRRGP